ncbi:MAG: phosphate signaling complex protein PhoU [Mariprofundaceae bacterium]|nr:phosphate signaling complex protein PhoU [Mariprofundaceae bacterium]
MQHTMKRFDEELVKLKEHVLSMGGLVERAIKNSTKAMLEHDEKRALRTIERDHAINAMEVACDDMTRDILVRRQPAAGDLRFVLAVIKVVTDLERMGDLAAGIAQGMIRGAEHPPQDFSNLDAISEKVQRQVHRALDALARGDVDLALVVIEKDDGIDRLYKRMYRELLTFMMEDPRSISASFILSNVAKNLERISAHATNIAEMVIYIEKGHDIRHVDHEAAAKMLASDGKDD